MKTKIGFSFDEQEDEKSEIEIGAASPEQADQAPVRSIVKVRFKDGREYPYYNDRFDLHTDDVVYVDGKLAGMPGIVYEVTTKFKVSLAHYKRVIAKLNLAFHGKFRRSFGMMYSCDSTLCAQQIKSWFYPPQEEEEVFVTGDGYEIDLANIDTCADIHPQDMEKAFALFKEGALQSICIENGVGQAIIQGSRIHTVDFTIEGGRLKNLYCDCISPDLCKHMLAVCLALHMLQKSGAALESGHFAALGCDLFYNIVSRRKTDIIL